MARHGRPTAGQTPEGGRGQKPPKSQISQTHASGATMPKATAKLWGIFSGSTKRKK